VTAPRRVLFVSGSGASATLRYRVRLPEEALRSRGVLTAAVHFTDRRAAGLAERADVVVLYRCPGGLEIVELVERLHGRPSPPLVTYDVDDLVFRPEHLEGMDFLDSLTVKQQETFTSDVALRARLVPYADLVTGSTPQILAELALLTESPSALLPNGVGLLGARSAEAARLVPRSHAGFRLGYFSGSATHDADWASIEDGVVEFLRGHRDAELWLVGKVKATAALATVSEQVRTLPLVEWAELPTLLRSVDVTLAPLARTPFTEAKSAIKWLEAALVETPTIATPTPPFEAVITPGRSGLLASSPADWFDALGVLAEDGALRLEMGSVAREAALALFGPDVQAQRLVDVLGVGAPAAPRAYTAAVMPRRWRPVPVLLDPYPFPSALRSLSLRPDAAHLPSAYATESLAATAKLGRKITRAVRRRAYRTAARVLGRR
jgi:glycosyltransferase involved in cell wall biosynthesis